MALNFGSRQLAIKKSVIAVRTLKFDVRMFGIGLSILALELASGQIDSAQPLISPPVEGSRLRLPLTFTLPDRYLQVVSLLDCHCGDRVGFELQREPAALETPKRLVCKGSFP